MNNFKISKKKLSEKKRDSIKKKLYKDIENDIDTFLSVTSLPDIKLQLEEWDNNYYSGLNSVSDYTYDKISDYYYSKTIGDKSDKIGFTHKDNTSLLPRYMGSLDKGKPGESRLSSFLNSYSGTKVISEKLDGNSLLIGKSEDGVHRAYTRGNGIKGKDISHILPFLKTKKKIKIDDLIGKLDNDTYIRGELIISKINWERNPNIGSNARNVVAGLTHRKEYTKRDYILIESILDFRAYEILYNPSMTPQDMFKPNTPQNMFKQLSKWGFDTPVWISVLNSDCTQEFLKETLTQFTQYSEYEIDGIVVANNINYEPVTNKNPVHAIAFKMDPQTGIKTKVINIIWDITKSAIYKPTLQVETVNIDGTNISRAYAYNAKYILDNKIGKNSEVEIVKGGGVIPKVLRVNISQFNIETDFPPSSNYRWIGKDIYAINTVPIIEKELSIRQIENFIKILDISSIKIGIISVLYDYGFKNVESYIRLKNSNELIKDSPKGINIKTADKIFGSLTEKLQNVDISTFAASLPCFDGVGKKTIQKLISNIPNFYDKNISELRKLIPEIESFGPKLTENIINGINCFKKYKEIYIKMGYHFSNDSTNLGPLSGNEYCFSGIRDKELSMNITKLGGIVSNNFKNGTILIVADPHNWNTTSKGKKAVKYGYGIGNQQDKLKIIETFKKEINDMVHAEN